MKRIASGALAVAIVGLALSVASGSALAGSGNAPGQGGIAVSSGLGAAAGATLAGSRPAIWYNEMKTVCDTQGGRFESKWLYNDQGVQWGRVLSCSTSEGYVSCQDSVCRSGHWTRSSVASAANGDSDSAQFPAEPERFAHALAELSSD